MTIGECFRGRLSLYGHPFFGELMKAKVVRLFRERGPSEALLHLAQSHSRCQEVKVTPLIWGYGQLWIFYELCNEGRVVFDFRSQDHVHLFSRMVKGMEGLLEHEKGDTYEALLILVRAILVSVRRNCIPPDGTVQFGAET